MKTRYRYRVYPTPVQVDMLNRTFGCARVVFNDVLALRKSSFEAGERLKDSAIQTRVITEAKKTEERAWLSEVSSVALVQSVADANLAYRNWFNSLSGKRNGRKVGHPRVKRRHDSKQSIRLTRNGFSLRENGSLYVAKVGDLRVRWSRALPSEPSSVTIVREADGRYYASFVVDVFAKPTNLTDRECGVDLGLETFATIYYSDGTHEKVENPRTLRRRERHLARLQRSLSRKKKGSANRKEAVRRVAVAHRKVREARSDHMHKLSARLVRENQAVYAENLSIAGLARTRLAKSVHDAGWGQFLSAVEYKAARDGRTFVRIDRWFPSTQLCSACGMLGGKKPLSVRTWVCDCGAQHDRDVNAAKNILAAGRVATACGADISPGVSPAARCEAGTHSVGAAA